MTTTALQDAARRALARFPGSDAADEGAVERASFDVTVDGRTELVTITLHDRQLVCSSTDGRVDGPHVAAALRVLAGEPVGQAVARRSFVPHAGQGASTTSPGTIRTLTGMPAPVGADHLAMADALDDVVTAVARLGLEQALQSPTLEETIDRLVRSAPSPLPLGVARWVGRLRSAVATRNVAILALVLEGAAQLAVDLRGAPSPEGSRRRVAWLGPSADEPGDVGPLYDRTFVEVAREWLPGVSRASIERRYLVDLQAGAIYREERLRGAQGASVGPCPRVITAGLAEVEHGASPDRIRLLQYTLSIDVGGSEWGQVAEWAAWKFGDLAGTYRDALKASPGLAEPFAIVGPAHCDVDEDGRVVLLDVDGLPLPLARADDPTGALVLDALADGGDVEWVAGRLVHADGTLMVVPASVATREAGRTLVRRIT